MRLTGTLLELEDYSGEFKGDDGTMIPFAGIRMHVLDGREVIKVKIPKDLLTSHGYKAQTPVDLRVTVAAQAGARGAYLTVGLLGNFPVAAPSTATPSSQLTGKSDH